LPAPPPGYAITGVEVIVRVEAQPAVDGQGVEQPGAEPTDLSAVLRS
jgi:hypothetical protein